MNHTPEPWKLVISDGENLCIRQDTSYGFRRVAIASKNAATGWTQEDEANAQRIVACVNACAGIKNPEAIPDLIASFKEISAHCETYVPGLYGSDWMRQGLEALAKLEGK